MYLTGADRRGAGNLDGNSGSPGPNFIHFFSYFVMAKNAMRRRAQIANLRGAQIWGFQIGDTQIGGFSKSEEVEIGGPRPESPHRRTRTGGPQPEGPNRGAQTGRPKSGGPNRGGRIGRARIGTARIGEALMVVCAAARYLGSHSLFLAGFQNYFLIEVFF